MKRLVIILSLLMIGGLAFAQASADSINMPMPMLMNPFFDSFSFNYNGAAALGRGGTGITSFGGLDSSLHNPAAFWPEKTEIALEFGAKPAIAAEDYPYEAQWGANNPLAIAGFGLPLGKKLSFGLLYSQPKSIVLDAYSIEMHGGAYILNRRPIYYLHQFTANLGYHSGPLHLGVNLHNQLHQMDDIPFLRSFDRVNENLYIPRVELGALYAGDSGDIGLVFTLPSNADAELAYRNYDSLLPLKVGVGTSFREGPRTWLAELDYEQYSAVHASYDDRLRIKAGMEFKPRNVTYRLGYMYAPEVYSGIYNIPLNSTASQDTSNVWDQVATYHTVENNTQHFLSVGIGYEHEIGSINVGYMQSLSADAPRVQFNLGLSFYLDALIKKPPKEPEDYAQESIRKYP